MEELFFNFSCQREREERERERESKLFPLRTFHLKVAAAV
jgi:hypothetical protein